MVGHQRCNDCGMPQGSWMQSRFILLTYMAGRQYSNVRVTAALGR